MSGVALVYVQLSPTLDDLVWLRECYPHAGDPDEESGYALVARHGSATAPAVDAQELAEEFATNAVYLGLETVGGMLLYERWNSGGLVRSFTYAADDGWSRVEGTPETWEATLFGSPVANGAQEPAINPEDVCHRIKACLRLPGFNA